MRALVLEAGVDKFVQLDGATRRIRKIQMSGQCRAQLQQIVVKIGSV